MEATHPATEGAIDEISQRYGAYEPKGPLDWETFMDSQSGLFTELADAYQRLGERLTSDFPMAGMPSGDMWGDITAQLKGLADHADDMAARFKVDFENELKRAHEPRPGEEVLDVRGDD